MILHKGFHTLPFPMYEVCSMHNNVNVPVNARCTRWWSDDGQCINGYYSRSVLTLHFSISATQFSKKSLRVLQQLRTFPLFECMIFNLVKHCHIIMPSNSLGTKMDSETWFFQMDLVLSCLPSLFSRSSFVVVAKPQNRRRDSVAVIVYCE